MPPTNDDLDQFSDAVKIATIHDPNSRRHHVRGGGAAASKLRKNAKRFRSKLRRAQNASATHRRNHAAD